MTPVRPGDKSRLWGVNPFAARPMYGSASREDVALRCGYRAPASSRQERGAQSGLRLAVVDPGATVTAPGVASYEKDGASGRAPADVSKNGDDLSKVFAKRVGDCTSSLNGARLLVENANGVCGQVCVRSRVSPLRISRWRAKRAGGSARSRRARVRGVAEMLSVRSVLRG